MAQTLFAWLLVVAILVAAYPWAAWLLARASQQDSAWLPILLALALSVGALTLLMFWQAVVGLPFNLWAITLPYFLLMLPGWWLWRRDRLGVILPRLPASRLARLALGLMALVSAAVLLNAAYWPFYRDDTLGIYARYAKLMAETGTLVPFAGRDDAFYQAYPIQMPLAYTYTYLASGWLNDYLARVIPALFSLGCIPAAFVLGRLLFSDRAGWLAALLLATMPTVARWASSGYVDLPMAFLYALSAVFAWRLWRDGRPLDALLAGLTMGLAAWTKNAALLGVLFLAAWLAYGWLKRRFGWRLVLLALAACAVIAAPWYVRNWLEARLLVPPTAWVEQAEPSLSNLLIYITLPDNFALTGWLIVGGIVNAVWSIITSVGTHGGAPLQDNRAGSVGTRHAVSLQHRSAASVPDTHRFYMHLFLLLWTLPFFAVWWLLVSYDPRFLLLFLPLLAVLAGGWLADLWDKLPRQWQPRILVPVMAVLVLLALYNAWIAVDYKREILRNPLMGDAEKRAIVLNGR